MGARVKDNRENLQIFATNLPKATEDSTVRGVHSAVDEIRRSVFAEVARLAYEGDENQD